MTLRLYADRKRWPLENVASGHGAHDRCMRRTVANCETAAVPDRTNRADREPRADRSATTNATDSSRLPSMPGAPHAHGREADRHPTGPRRQHRARAGYPRDELNRGGDLLHPSAPPAVSSRPHGLGSALLPRQSRRPVQRVSSVGSQRRRGGKKRRYTVSLDSAAWNAMRRSSSLGPSGRTWTVRPSARIASDFQCVGASLGRQVIGS